MQTLAGMGVGSLPRHRQRYNFGTAEGSGAGNSRARDHGSNFRAFGGSLIPRGPPYPKLLPSDSPTRQFENLACGWAKSGHAGPPVFGIGHPHPAGGNSPRVGTPSGVLPASGKETQSP